MSTMHTLDDMSASLKLKIQDLKVGEVSSPSVIQMPDETSAYRILKVNKKIEEHKANLIDDFTIIKDFTLNAKKQDVLLKWISKKINETFIQFNETVTMCEFKNNWIK